MRRLLPPGDGPAEIDDGDLDAAYAMGPDILRANMVTSLDGEAAFGGTVRALSDPTDLALLLRLRRYADVLLVGAGTVRAENYRPVRLDEAVQAERVARGQAAVPPIAVVTGSLELALDAPFFTDAAARPLVLTTERVPPERVAAAGEVADVLVLGERRVAAADLVAALRARGLRRILCEGGPALLGELVAADLLDELCLTVSPRFAGAQSGADAVSPLPAPHPLVLRHVLEHDGFLYLRYTRGS